MSDETIQVTKNSLGVGDYDFTLLNKMGGKLKMTNLIKTGITNMDEIVGGGFEVGTQYVFVVSDGLSRDTLTMFFKKKLGQRAIVINTEMRSGINREVKKLAKEQNKTVISCLVGSNTRFDNRRMLLENMVDVTFDVLGAYVGRNGFEFRLVLSSSKIKLESESEYARVKVGDNLNYSSYGESFSTGIDELDELLQGGLERENVYTFYVYDGETAMDLSNVFETRNGPTALDIFVYGNYISPVQINQMRALAIMGKTVVNIVDTSKVEYGDIVGLRNGSDITVDVSSVSKSDGYLRFTLGESDIKKQETDMNTVVKI